MALSSMDKKRLEQLRSGLLQAANIHDTDARLSAWAVICYEAKKEINGKPKSSKFTNLAIQISGIIKNPDKPCEGKMVEVDGVKYKLVPIS